VPPGGNRDSDANARSRRAVGRSPEGPSAAARPRPWLAVSYLGAAGRLLCITVLLVGRPLNFGARRTWGAWARIAVVGESVDLCWCACLYRCWRWRCC